MLAGGGVVTVVASAGGVTSLVVSGPLASSSEGTVTSLDGAESCTVPSCTMLPLSKDQCIFTLKSFGTLPLGMAPKKVPHTRLP